MMTPSEAAATNHTIFPTPIDLPMPSRVELTTSPSRALRIGFWSFTALFCLQIAFTAYAQLALPQVTEMFHHLGFPDYFRVELSWAKLVGAVVLLAPLSARLKEWAYAGFAITLVSALIAHFSLGDGPAVWSWAAGTGVLLAGSYFFWLRMQSSRPIAEV